MSLAVIGAGFARTGTYALKLALEQLGLGPCHHMHGVFGDPSSLAPWEAAANGEAVDWAAVFSRYRSAIDWPSAHYWRELAEAFPNARVLLSVRPPDRWYRSFSRTIKKLIETRHTNKSDYHRAILDVAHRIIAVETFGDAVGDEDRALTAFQARIDDVRQTIPAGRLLVFDVAEGWAPLCGFIGVPIPKTEFPHGNTVEDFWRYFGKHASR